MFVIYGLLGNLEGVTVRSTLSPEEGVTHRLITEDSASAQEINGRGRQRQ